MDNPAVSEPTTGRGLDREIFRLAVPTFATLVSEPDRIANGIGFGFVACVIVNAVSGRAKQISPLLWIVAALFMIRFAFFSE